MRISLSSSPAMRPIVREGCHMVGWASMKNIRIDADGTPRCWNCGAKGFTEKRTFRSKVMVGVGALITKKKMKCQRCGEYNDTGNGQPYDGPDGRKYRKEWQAEQTARNA